MLLHGIPTHGLGALGERGFLELEQRAAIGVGEIDPKRETVAQLGGSGGFLTHRFVQRDDAESARVGPAQSVALEGGLAAIEGRAQGMDGVRLEPLRHRYPQQATVCLGEKAPLHDRAAGVERFRQG